MLYKSCSINPMSRLGLSGARLRNLSVSHASRPQWRYVGYLKRAGQEYQTHFARERHLEDSLPWREVAPLAERKKAVCITITVFT